MKLPADLFITKADFPFFMDTNRQTFAIPVAKGVSESSRPLPDPFDNCVPLGMHKSGLPAGAATDTNDAAQSFPVEQVNKRRCSLTATPDALCHVLNWDTGGHPLYSLNAVPQAAVRFLFQHKFQSFLGHRPCKFNCFWHLPSLWRAYQIIAIS